MLSTKEYIYRSGKFRPSTFILVAIIWLANSMLCAHVIEAATIGALSSGGQSVVAGQLFSVNVIVSTSGTEALNAVSGTISYPISLLQLVSVDKSGSIISFWISEPKYSNATGQVQFEGGVYNPGFTGTQGKIATILFKAKATGTADISFLNASILANDGQGTNILDRTNPAKIQIVPEVAQPLVEPVRTIAIRSATHPDQQAWYNTGDAAFAWDLPPGALSVRTGFDQNQQGVPSDVSSAAISEITHHFDDGVWYFHLQVKTADGWGSISTFKVRVDTNAVNPPKFDRFPTTLTEGDVLLVSGAAPSNSSVHLMLRTSLGKLYEQTVKAGEGGRFQAAWTDQLDNDTYNLTAEATSQRGIKSSPSANLVITIQPSRIERVAKPVIDAATIYATIIGIIFLCALWTWYLIQHFRHFRRKVRADVRRTNQLIHVEFKKLLDQAHSKRKLTAEEERMMSILRENIHRAEEEVESDVRDIGQS